MMLNAARRTLATASRTSSLAYLSTVSTSPLVLVERNAKDRVAVIRLNDPKRLNAMTVDMGNAFSEAIDELAEAGEDVGAVLLTGSGRAFSAGGDIEFLRDRSKDSPSRNAVIMRDFYRRMLHLRDLNVPIIAAINGPAIGAGLAVSLACDMRVSSRSASMGLTFVNLGLHPGMGSTFFLPQLTGFQQAAKLLLTGEVINGEEALKLGIVMETTSDEEGACEERAREIASSIANGSPVAVRTAIRSLRLLQEQQAGGLEVGCALTAHADNNPSFTLTFPQP